MRLLSVSNEQLDTFEPNRHIPLDAEPLWGAFRILEIRIADKYGSRQY